MSLGSLPHRLMSARYGLRGVRVGEASHPGPPKLVVIGPLGSTAATLVDGTEPTQWESGAEFSPASRGSGLISSPEVPTVRMDVDDSPTPSVVGALERDLMSSPEADEDAESDGESVVSGDVPDVEIVEEFHAPEVHLSPVLREAFRRLDRIDLETIFSN